MKSPKTGFTISRLAEVGITWPIDMERPVASPLARAFGI